jgi:DNA-binding beta-propeller fold protein YncE
MGNPVPSPVFTFVSSNTNIVAVSPTGVVYAQGATGSASITVTLDTFDLHVPVTVYARSTTLRVSPLSVSIAVGASKQLVVDVLDSLGSPILGASVSFTSNNPALFSVAASGLITSIAGSGSGSVTVHSGSLSKSVLVVVGTGVGGIAGVITATTQLPDKGYGVAVGTSGDVFAGVLNSTAVVHGTLPSHALGGPLLVGGGPLGMTVNPAGTRAYVALDGLGQVAVVDVSGPTVLPPITGLSSHPFTVAVSPDNQTVYVGTEFKVYFVDAATQALLDSIPASLAGHMAVHPSQPLLYVSMTAAGTVVEINTTTRQATRTFPVGGAPQAIGVSADNHLYIANEAGSLQVWDLIGGNEIDHIPLVGGGFGLAVTQEALVVAETFCGCIEVFDRATDLPRSLLTPGGTPRRVAVNSAGTVAVVANEGGWVDFIE